MSENPDQPHARKGTTPRRPAFVAFGAALALIGLTGWWLGDEPPSARWRDGDGEPFAAIAEVGAEQTFTVEVELPRPMHVYVASHDLVRGTLAMRPSATLRSDLPANPLPAGTHALPGRHLDHELRWHAGDGVGLNSVILIASEEPLEDLRRTLAACRQVGNAAFPDRPILGAYAPEGGMESTPARSRPAHPLLETCANLVADSADGALRAVPDRPGVYTATLRLRSELALGGGLEKARREMAEKIGPMLEGTLPMPGGPGAQPAAPPPEGR